MYLKIIKLEFLYFKWKNVLWNVIGINGIIKYI